MRCVVTPLVVLLLDLHVLAANIAYVVRAGEVAEGAVLLSIAVANVISYNAVTGWGGARQATGGTGQNKTSAGRSMAGQAITRPDGLWRDDTRAWAGHCRAGHATTDIFERTKWIL